MDLTLPIVLVSYVCAPTNSQDSVGPPHVHDLLGILSALLHGEGGKSHLRRPHVFVCHVIRHPCYPALCRLAIDRVVPIVSHQGPRLPLTRTNLQVRELTSYHDGSVIARRRLLVPNVNLLLLQVMVVREANREGAYIMNLTYYIVCVEYRHVTRLGNVLRVFVVIQRNPRAPFGRNKDNTINLRSENRRSMLCPSYMRFQVNQGVPPTPFVVISPSVVTPMSVTRVQDYHDGVERRLRRFPSCVYIS